MRPPEIETQTPPPTCPAPVMGAPAPSRRPGASAQANRQFATTHWSVVDAIAASDNEAAREAWERVAQWYWYPLYAFARRSRVGPEDAEDLTQSFCAHILEKNVLAKASKERGRFRSYLLCAFKFHLRHQRRQARTKRKGGHVAVVPLEMKSAEERYAFEPPDCRDPERLYERRCALIVLERGVDRLRQEFVQKERRLVWERLHPLLDGDPPSGGYAQIAADLGLTESNVKVTVHRMRRRLGEFVREELSRTVSNAAELEEELEHLKAVLSAD